MKPEQQRIAIAEACGWKNADHPDAMKLKQGWTMPEKWCMDPNGVLQFNHKRPNYLNDLNAMHEAVSIFDYDQADQFEDHLCDICKRSNDEKENPAPWRFAVVNATASQRAEAFLRTIGKWKEAKP
jgi:hypothetical protein